MVTRAGEMLRGYKHWLLFQRAWLLFPAPIWYLVSLTPVAENGGPLWTPDVNIAQVYIQATTIHIKTILKSKDYLTVMWKN